MNRESGAICFSGPPCKDMINGPQINRAKGREITERLWLRAIK